MPSCGFSRPGCSHTRMCPLRALSPVDLIFRPCSYVTNLISQVVVSMRLKDRCSTLVPNSPEKRRQQLQDCALSRGKSSNSTDSNTTFKTLARYILVDGNNNIYQKNRNPFSLPFDKGNKLNFNNKYYVLMLNK